MEAHNLASFDLNLAELFLSSSMEMNGLTFQQILGKPNGVPSNHFDITDSELKAHDLTIITDAILPSIGGKYHLTVSNCTFKGDVRISMEMFKSYNFYNCTFEKKVSIEGGNKCNVHMFNCSFSPFFVHDAPELSLTVHQCHGPCILSCNDYKKIALGDTVNDNGNMFTKLEVQYASSQTGTIEITKNIIGDMLLSGTQGKDQTTFINGNKVKYIKFSYLFITGIFRIHGLTAEESDIATLSVDTKYLDQQTADTANRFLKRSIFSIYKSDLGKALFNNANLYSYNLITIAQSTITEIHFIDCRWPVKIWAHEFWVLFDFAKQLARKKIPRDEYFRIKENYRQLKVASSKHSDFISEQLFHGKEMNAYFKALRCRKEPGTKTILWLSNWTSDYGQSFTLPLLLLLAINALIVTAYYFTYDFWVCNFVDFNNTWSFIGEVVRLSNPLHKNQCELSGADFVMDTMTRVISSYLIYNIIRATRRFVR